MKVFMFPGQGAQSKGMGAALFDEFSELTEKADDILGYSIKELCLTDPRKELNQTQFTQPALYVVNALAYYKKIQVSGQKPDFVLGHSLGEFNALLAAECFDFEAGLKLVKKRGELMSQATDGAMAAILNATKKQIDDVLESTGLTGIDLANYNSPLQTVISGLRADINQAQFFFQEAGILFYPLNTSGAFHSRYMQSSKEKFESYLKKFKFSHAKIPVISNVTARPYQDDEITGNLSNQIASAVRWSDSVQYLLALETPAQAIEFEEIGDGHGDVLAKLLHKIREQTPKAVIQEHKNNIAGQPSLTIKAVDKDVLKDNKQEKAAVDELFRRQHELPAAFFEAEEKVASWNNHYPVGTKVKSSVVDDEGLETSTEAMVLFGQRPAVYIKGYNGYFDLNEVTPL